MCDHVCLRDSSQRNYLVPGTLPVAAAIRVTVSGLGGLNACMIQLSLPNLICQHGPQVSCWLSFGPCPKQRLASVPLTLLKRIPVR